MFLWHVDKFGILYEEILQERGRNFIDTAGESFLEEESYLIASIGVESQSKRDIETILMEVFYVLCD